MSSVRRSFSNLVVDMGHLLNMISFCRVLFLHPNHPLRSKIVYSRCYNCCYNFKSETFHKQQNETKGRSFFCSPKRSSSVLIDQLLMFINQGIDFFSCWD